MVGVVPNEEENTIKVKSSDNSVAIKVKSSDQSNKVKILGTYVTPGELQEGLEKKQDKLTAGDNITIDEDNVISAEIPVYQSATETEEGIVYLATEQDAISGLDDSKAMTPLKTTKVIYENVGRGIELGFNGTLESGILTFEPPSESGTYTLKHNYRYELDLLASLVGSLDDNVIVRIKNGTDTIKINNILKNDVTVKEIKQIQKYDTSTGYRWIFNATFKITEDGNKVFVMDNVIANMDLSEYRKSSDQDVIDATKQDKLTAGTGIKIENNVISNTQTSAEWGNITGTLSEQTDLQNALNGKQPTGQYARTNTSNTFTDTQIINTNNEKGFEVYSPLSGGYLYVTRGGDVPVQMAIKAGLSGGTFGTNTNHQFQFRTNNIARMTVGTDGSVKMNADVATDSNDNQVATTKWVNAKGYVTTSYHDSTKQDKIDDLSTIRSNAESGKSASDTISGYGDIVTYDASDFASSDLVPQQATSTNKLADKDFVNSSIATETANFVGTFDTLEELQAVQNPTNNDYGFVKSTDTLGNRVFNKYKYSSKDNEWKFEYSLNNSSFTEAQWKAINSGATDEIINSISDKVDVDDLGMLAYADKITNGDIDGTINQDKITDLQTALDLKYDASNPNGYITSGDIPTNVSAFNNDSGYITSAYHDSTKQDTLIAGNGIDITDNTISANNIFVATYGTTTYAEITQALADGKTVIAKRTVSDGRTLYFDYSMEDSNHDYRFYTSAGSQIMYGITCTTSSAWGNSNLIFQKQLTAGDNITIDNNTISATDTTYTAGNGIAISNNKVSNTKMFTITEDMVTVTTDATKGVAPYSTSYGYTNVEISADSGIEWVEGALYNFIIDTKLVVSSTYRNVRIRIGSSGDWKPLMGSSSTIASGSSYFVKAYTTIYQYKSVYQSGGALHVQTDNNTTYSYLVNTIPVGSLKIDNNGYGARYSLVFPTTPLSTIDERFSSLVKSSNSGTKKVAQTDLTFYADRHPQYLSSGSIAAGGVSASATYQDYTGMDLRYSVNTNETWVSVNKKVFLWLKDFNEEDMSFKADATIGNIFSIDKLATKFPNTMTGDVYIYFLGWNSSTWYTLSPNFTQEDKIFKYTPSTGVLVELNAEEHAKKQDKLPDGDTGYVLTKTDDGVEWSKGGVTATYDETTETITFA